MKHAKQYFENHSGVDKLYFTSDSLAFFDKQNASNHARRLQDKTVTSMTREELDQEAMALTTDNWDEDLYDDYDQE